MTTLEIARMTPKERLDLIGELWDSLAPEDVRLSPTQDAELQRRMATFDDDVKTASSWEKVDADLDNRPR
jgi:putative addiction module component (TIGR02574 family)